MAMHGEAKYYQKNSGTLWDTEISSCHIYTCILQQKVVRFISGAAKCCSDDGDD